MTSFVKRTAIDVPREALRAWHMRPGALERLSPTWTGLRALGDGEAFVPGAWAKLALAAGPLIFPWHARYEADAEGFRDVQEHGPMKRWVHAHHFLAGEGHGSILEDAIDYELPLGALGRLVAGRAVAHRLERLFAYRHELMRADLERHAAAGLSPSRIALSGASGLVGAALRVFLSTGGHTVLPLVRRAPRVGTNEILFDPQQGKIDAAALEGTDAVVHLAGESISSRWTQAKKERIRRSRFDGTRLVADALANLARPPRVLVSASAIGYYGDRGEETLEETSAPGRGFLPEICEGWEAATLAAERRGIRVVRLRIGIVLGAAGGALGKMSVPFRFGVGGKIGDGRHWMSWIALDDLLGAILFSIASDTLAGPVNAVGPAPVRNDEFARTLARVLHRPALVPLPALAVRAIFGRMGEEVLLSSMRVLPTRLERAGFRFRHPTLEDALRFELGILARP
jgi:uncharacterized protein (TIGR01777 family)